MKKPEMPERPVPSAECRDWFLSHVGRAVFDSNEAFMAKFGNDLPSPVREYFDADEAWQRTVEELRKKLPFDTLDVMYESDACFRIYGGPWIPCAVLRANVLEATVPADRGSAQYRVTVIVSEAIEAAFARMNEDEWTQHVAALYEHLNIMVELHKRRQEQSVALVLRLRAGEGL